MCVRSLPAHTGAHLFAPSILPATCHWCNAVTLFTSCLVEKFLEVVKVAQISCALCSLLSVAGSLRIGRNAFILPLSGCRCGPWTSGIVGQNALKAGSTYVSQSNPWPCTRVTMTCPMRTFGSQRHCNLSLCCEQRNVAASQCFTTAATSRDVPASHPRHTFQLLLRAAETLRRSDGHGHVGGNTSAGVHRSVLRCSCAHQ